MNANAALIAAQGGVDILELPCGCAFGGRQEDRTFLVAPCSLDCRYYLYTLEESAKTAKPLRIEDHR